MLKAEAWPYPIFEDVQCVPAKAIYDELELKVKSTEKGWIISGTSLKDRSTGKIRLTIDVSTPAAEVSAAVFGIGVKSDVICGVRVLCKESKFRSFTVADKKQSVVVDLPLERLRGVALVTPVFVCSNETVASNGVKVSNGSVVGIPSKPIFLTIDEDWTGESIPVDWLDFDKSKLPVQALIHVEFSGGGHVPKVWLNSKHKGHLEHVLLRKGDSSPAGLAGAAMREFFWVQVWEKVLIWALKEQSDENEDWPATRIAKHWRTQFEEHGWEMPSIDDLDGSILNEFSFRIQHCLATAPRLSRVHGILRFQPEMSSTS